MHGFKGNETIELLKTFTLPGRKPIPEGTKGNVIAVNSRKPYLLVEFPSFASMYEVPITMVINVPNS